MRFLRLCAIQVANDRQSGAMAIGIGLAILAVAMLWPGMPAVFGMALVALGATDVTMVRFRGSRAFLPVMMLHLATYGILYALFLSATLHGATRSGAGLSIFNFLDLALSTCPLAIALERVWCRLHARRIS